MSHKHIFRLSLLAFVVMIGISRLDAADATIEPEDQVDGRWYTEKALRIGKQVFETHCMSCHGASGQGLAEDWKKPLADGSYPPPPLNGTAHTWHHPISILLRTINRGGQELGGKMPPFYDKLSEAEKVAVIAYFQNWWSDEVYQIWIQRGGLSH